MATIRKREWTHKGIRKTAWIVTYTDNGGKRRQETFERKKDADVARIRIEGEVSKGVHIANAESVKIGAALEEYVIDCERRLRIGDRMTLDHFRVMQFYARHVQQHFGNILIKDVKLPFVETVISELIEYLASATVKQIINVLKQVVKLALRRGWIGHDPLHGHPLHIPEKERMRYFPSKADLGILVRRVYSDREPYQTILSHVNNRAVVCLSLFTGMRVGEISGLQWENVNFENRTIQVRHSRARYEGLKKPKTKAGMRDIPASRQLLDVLERVLAYQQIVEAGKLDGVCNAVKWQRIKRRMLEGQKANMALPRTGSVIRAKGSDHFPAKTISKVFGELLVNCNVCEGDKPKFTIHAMRHAAASLLIESGLPPINIKAVMGHSNISTTFDIYGHLFPEDERIENAIKDISNAFHATTERQELIAC